jgi:hypothetical protein
MATVITTHTDIYKYPLRHKIPGEQMINLSTNLATSIFLYYS